MKKLLCLIMAIMMIAAAFSGCGSKEEKVKNDLYDPEVKLGDTGGLKLPLTGSGDKLTWLIPSDSDYDGKWFPKMLRKATGVNVEFIEVPASAKAEKYPVMVASKTVPDISAVPTAELADDLCRQGYFAAVEDYVDKLPNFKRTFVDNKDNSWIFKSYASSDGKLYGFYGYDWQRDINHGVMYRKDIFDKHNIPMWNSTEEFYQTLKKLKELYPDSTPLAQKTADGTFGTFAVHWGLVAHSPSYIEELGKWVYADTTEQYKDMLDFLKKLYDEGLIDPEFLTCTAASWTSKMTQKEKAFITLDWIGRMPMFKAQTAEEIPEYDLRFANPIGPDQKYEALTQICWPRYVVNNKNTETAFKLLDFVLSPAGKELLTLGVEGETYEIGENGMAKYLEFPDDAQPTISDLSEKYGMFTEDIYLSFDRRSAYFNFTEQEGEAQKMVQDKNRVRPLDPVLPLSAEDKERSVEILNELTTASKEFATKYILGAETGDKAWDDWKIKAEKMGSKELENIYNEAQKDYDK